MAAATGAIVSSVSQAVTGVFGFLSKGKKLKIEEEKTNQLKLQIESTEDVELQKSLQKKLDVQLTAQNTAAEADRVRRIGSLATAFAVLALIGLVIVQVFKFKTKKETPQAPIILR